MRTVGNPPKRDLGINDLQGLRTLCQVQSIELVIPDIHETELIFGHIVKGAFEQCSWDVKVRLIKLAVCDWCIFLFLFPFFLFCDRLGRIIVTSDRHENRGGENKKGKTKKKQKTKRPSVSGNGE
jgi:hypothetical protein